MREILDGFGLPQGIENLPPIFAQPANCRWAPPSGGQEFEDFSGCDSTRRLDKIAQARIRLRKNFGKTRTFEAYYRWTDWNSSVQEFNFDRHIVGFAATFRR